MNRAYVDFGSNVKVILMRNKTLIQYITFDYSEDSLSYLYALLNEKSIKEIVYCVPSYFSKALLTDSASLTEEKLTLASGYFCISLKDLQKLEHLAEALGIENVAYTEHRFLCNDDNCICVMELDNLYQVFVRSNGKLVEYDTLTEELVESIIQRYCLKYNIKNVVDLVNSTETDKLSECFDNISSDSTKDIFCDLTYMAYLVNAQHFPADSYFNSGFRNQALVSDDDQSEPLDSNVLPTEATHLEIQSDAQEKDFVGSENTDSFKAKKKQKHEKLLHNTKKSANGSFIPILAGTLAIAVVLNAGMFYMRSSKQKTYNDLYSDFTEKTSELNSLKSRYTMLSSMVTDESGKSAMQFINDTKLLKNKKITLQSFTVEGSTVTIIVHAKDDNTFWKFHDSLSGKYEISNVSEGDNTSNSGVAYSMTLLL